MNDFVERDGDIGIRGILGFVLLILSPKTPDEVLIIADFAAIEETVDFVGSPDTRYDSLKQQKNRLEI